MSLVTALAEKVVNIEHLNRAGMAAIPVPTLGGGNDVQADGMSTAAVDVDQAPARVLRDCAAIRPIL